MSQKTLRIATRKSPLALCQAEHIKQELLKYHPHLSIELCGITTEGDIHLDTPLAEIGGKGLFVKELDQALLNHEADIAVHSVKDLPAMMPNGLTLTTICQRGDPRDAFISNNYGELIELPISAKVGTSSLRRHCQIKKLRPDLKVVNLRGNVHTRLKKLDEGEFDAIILAAAGMHRLNFSERISSYFPTDVILPAVGQGALGIETRLTDIDTQALLAPLDDASTRLCVLAERAFNRSLNGGCQVPIAGHATLYIDQLSLRGLVSSVDGVRRISGYMEGAAHDAEAIGESLAEELLKQGAGLILQEVYNKRQPKDKF